MGGAAKTMRLLDVTTYEDSDVISMSSLGVCPTAHKRAVKWAVDTDDALLHLQLQCCHMVVDLRQAMCATELLGRKMARESDIKKREPTSERIESIHKLRSRLSVLNTFVEESGHIFDPATVAGDDMHLPCLDNVINLRSVWASAESESAAIEARFGKTWSVDISSIVEAINVFCPAWQPVNDKLLAHTEMKRALINMPDKHANSVGPLCQGLKSQLSVLKTLVGKPLVDPSTTKHIKSTVSFGVSTVVYRYLST